MRLRAWITGYGADSTVPDNPKAVDAMIYAGEGFDQYTAGSVTLLPDHTGELVSWGDLSMWADQQMIDWFDKNPGYKGEVVCVVREAVKQDGGGDAVEAALADARADARRGCGL